MYFGLHIDQIYYTFNEPKKYFFSYKCDQKEYFFSLMDINV